MPTERTLSTAEHRRTIVVSSAIATFARHGFLGTRIADVAQHAGISPAYVSKLFSSKERLFVAALDLCYTRIVEALERGARQSEDPSPTGLLLGMGGAYARLIEDRDLMMLQVHAQASTDRPAVAEAVRRGIGRVTDYVIARSGAGAADIQYFMAFGQLCHLLTSVDAFSVDEKWADVLTDSLRHSKAAHRARLAAEQETA
ncbi:MULTISPECIES: TetR/AcrR family transcriptional regulator [Streptomyces]|uniref:DNA-binding transcriptional regulator, AcrR family n=2 Tax=Streptomyces TaxID=1883 RepID=A0A1I6V3K0_9ACTN|nr:MULTISPECIES: TetR/AcrR family transcriptional regulator [Streptomyces]QKV68983.1 TetR/AcrR family transcriptional regulator [Streptomyces harbinensis]SFT08252.1 DNA-binding transcriptional regulator, AcrR family [Streptomyces harbinensis]